MEDKIIFDEENIVEPNIEKWEREEKDSQKEQNSSRETSQYEKPPENEENKFENEKYDTQVKNKNKDIKSETISSYLLNYTRKEKNEIANDTKIKKAKQCLFKLDIKLIPNNNKNLCDNPKTNENSLVIYCHEIAAFYFDEIYEKIYTLEELCKENRYFKVFPSNDEAKIFIDEFITTNIKNKNKFFYEFKNNTLKIHMIFSFFDKEKEIIFNVPKKKLNIQEKNNLLPEFLKEIQDKMFFLSEENKKLKNRSLPYFSHISTIKKLKNDLKDNNILNESNESIDVLNKTDIHETKKNTFMNRSFNYNKNSDKKTIKKVKNIKKVIKKRISNKQ